MLTPQAGVQVDRFDAPTDWQYSFPEGYTRLEYLESTGTQYIDTGVVRNLEHTYRMVGSVNYPTDVTTRQCQGVQGYFYFGTVNGHWQVAQSGNVNTNRVCQVNTFHQYNILFNPSQSEAIYQIDNHNGNVGITFTNEPQNAHICLFSLNNGILPCSCKNKQTLIYQDEILVRNLIPAKRNSDNKPGMLDLANTDGNGNYLFYVNQGSGADFTMGPELYRNKTQIDLRSKVNMDYTTNYEFNSNNELTWANPDICLKGPVNYTKVGSPTIVDNVASGFSDSDYFNLLTLTEETDIEIQLKFTTSNDISTGQYLMAWYQRPINTNRSGGLYINNNKYGVVVRSVSDTNYQLTGGSVSYNTTYYMKMIFTKSDKGLKIGISTDGINYTYGINSTLNANIAPFSQAFRIGRAIPINYYWQGSIDLSQTYIKVNGQMWFYGKNYSTSNIAVVPAGLAYNNTTTPSKGYVDMRTQVFTPAPEGVTYKRERHLQVVAPENNTISLLYGVASDYSKYSKFGLLAQVSSGSYDVYIDDVLYNTFTSNTQCDIEFNPNETGGLGSEYVAIGTCTTPEALTLHKILIKPNTSGATITFFRTKRTTGVSTVQEQGTLWIHYELSNNIELASLNIDSQNTFVILFAITAKNDIISSPHTENFCSSSYLEYMPCINNTSSFHNCLKNSKIKSIKITNSQTSTFYYTFSNNLNFEKIKVKDTTISSSVFNNSFYNTQKNRLCPKLDFTQATNISNAFVQNTNLYPTKLDVSDAKNLTAIGTYGTSTYPMRGLRGLKVSNEAPFSGSAPQINVNYTGLDRDNLVELFKSLPYNVGYTVQGTLTESPTGVFSGFSYRANYLQTSVPFTIQNNSDFDINIKFTTGTVGGQNQTLISFTDISDVYWIIIRVLQNKRLQFLTRQIDGTLNDEIISNLDIDDNTEYIVTCSCVDLNLSLILSKNGNIIYSRTIAVPSVLLNPNNNMGTYIGANSRGYDVWNGSIDLNETYISIYENGQWIKWFKGQPARESNPQCSIVACSGNNLTKVGSPTIDENGVASGFSSSNYLTVPSFLNFKQNENFKIMIRFKTPLSYPSQKETLLYSGYDGTGYDAGIFYNYEIEIKWYNFFNYEDDLILNLDTWYYLKISRVNNIIKLELSTDGINWNLRKEIEQSSAYSPQRNIRYGNSATTNPFPFNGSIDLNNTYIKAGNNYLMKGYITSSDQAIATSKNWDLKLTAN